MTLIEINFVHHQLMKLKTIYKSLNRRYLYKKRRKKVFQQLLMINTEF